MSVYSNPVSSLWRHRRPYMLFCRLMLVSSLKNGVLLCVRSLIDPASTCKIIVRLMKDARTFDFMECIQECVREGETCDLPPSEQRHTY